MIALACIFTYLVIMGAVWKPADNYAREHFDYIDRAPMACIITLLWPAVLPVFIGRKIASVVTDRENRVETKRRKEIEAAQHDAKIAEIKAREHAALDRELELIARSRDARLGNS